MGAGGEGEYILGTAAEPAPRQGQQRCRRHEQPEFHILARLGAARAARAEHAEHAVPPHPHLRHRIEQPLVAVVKELEVRVAAGSKGCTFNCN